MAWLPARHGTRNRTNSSPGRVPRRRSSPGRCPARPGLERLEPRLAMSGMPLGTTIAEFTPVGSTAYFVAGDGSSGRELWKTDGTGPGTVLVRDINPGGGSSFPESLTAVGSTLYFTAEDGVTGRQLWKTDGTAAGTQIVKRIATQPAGWPTALTRVGSMLYFSVDDGVRGRELWKSDGTAAGTRLVKDINPGAGESRPRGLTAAGSTLYFISDSGTSRAGLWKTDGTAAGTTLVRAFGQYTTLLRGHTIGPTLFVDRIRDLVPFGSGICFAARDDASGFELWTSDGTAAGTRLVRDIAPGVQESSPSGFKPLGSTLFFVAGDGVNGRNLWRTDGTAAGTMLVKDVTPGVSDAGPTELTVSGSSLFFVADGPSQGGTRSTQVWRSDGTEAGTKPVSTFTSAITAWNARFLTPFGSGVCFAARTDAAGEELWMSDGTPAGTVLVKDIAPGVADSWPGPLAPLGATLIFVAEDGVRGRELWRSDGTPTGTRRLADSPAAPVITLGTGVAGGATRAETLQETGVVTVAGAAGNRISVAFIGTTSGAVDTAKVFFKEVTGAGPGVPVSVVLSAADVTRLGDGLVYVNAVQVTPAGGVGPHASQVFTIDTRAPVPASVTPPPARPVVPGAVLRVTVTFPEAVTVRGTPFVLLTFDGNVVRRANHVSGSGTRTLVFEYRAVVGDRAARGPAVAAAITLAGGSITDAAGNAAGLSLRPPAAPRAIAFARL